jgi:hypothetical protein
MRWNDRTRQCLSMVVRDGRVKKLEPIDDHNCTCGRTSTANRSSFGLGGQTFQTKPGGTGYR